jgi:plasmid stabilization system protein ParE
VNKPLPVEVSDLAAAQIRAAETWWRLNRPKAPNAIREDLERASSFIAVQPQAGARARNANLPGVRRLLLARTRYHLYYRQIEAPKRMEVLAFWHASRGSNPPI